jgi:hypothetical protein
LKSDGLLLLSFKSESQFLGLFVADVNLLRLEFSVIVNNFLNERNVGVGSSLVLMNISFRLIDILPDINSLVHSKISKNSSWCS